MDLFLTLFICAVAYVGICFIGCLPDIYRFIRYGEEV